jgi:hypothetical protein
MSLKQTCKYCNNATLAKRLLGFYVGSNERLKLWECRECGGIWSNKTKGGSSL